jgi:hypothetical protein
MGKNMADTWPLGITETLILPDGSKIIDIGDVLIVNIISFIFGVKGIIKCRDCSH